MAENKPTLNIPAGNSPVTPESGAPVAPTRYINGEEASTADYKAAISSIKPIEDFKNLGQVPCARDSLLYAIGGGTAIGAVRFIGSQRMLTTGPKSAANWAVAAFCGIAIATWETCNSAREKELAQMRLIQERFPHRHVSNLKARGADWTPPPSSTEHPEGSAERQV